MATGGFHVDELPLISEDGEEDKNDLHVPLINGLQDGGDTRYSLVGEEEEDEEMGVKGVADVDFSPKRASQIELQKGMTAKYLFLLIFNMSLFVKGDIVIILGQTIDQKCYMVVNLRTSETGEVPSNKVTAGKCTLHHCLNI